MKKKVKGVIKTFKRYGYTLNNIAIKTKKVKDIIIFESNPELSGNSYEVYQKLISEGLNKKYKIYWLVESPEKYKEFPVENVGFLPYHPKSEKEKNRKKLILHSSKLIVSENREINKTNLETFSLHLHHGTVLKDVSGIYNFGKSYDCILCPSEHLKELYKRLFKVEFDQMYVSGYPRSDLLFKNDKTILVRMGYQEFNKIILWMPTFRQHKSKNRNDTTNNLPLGIPIFENMQQMSDFNEKLKDLNYVLALKLHPAQDKSFINAESFSNIKILEDEDLKKHNIKLYEFIGVTDALITDYSSVYYDYLLLEKPIGLTIDDLADYKLGFVYRDIDNYLIGDKISNDEHLFNFMQNLKNEKDEFYEKRSQLSVNMNMKTKYQGYTEEIYEGLLKKILL